jgi:anti-sigma B factor antagonist
MHQSGSSPSSDVTVALKGEYDVARASDLRHALLDIDVRGPNVIADMSEVTFVDSSALRALIEAQRALEAEGGSLRLAEVPRGVSRLLVLTQTGHLFGLDDQGS